MNVVQRPTAGSGRGYRFTGHHEIMFPLLSAAVLEALPRPNRGAPPVRRARPPLARR
jgi:hypothetical protein